MTAATRSSAARTLGLWVRIPLKAWMSAFILCLCCSVCRYRFCDELVPRPRSPTDYLRLRNWSETKRFTDALCSKWSSRNNGRQAGRLLGRSTSDHFYCHSTTRILQYVWISYYPHSSHVSHPSYFYLFDHPNDIWRRVIITNYLSMALQPLWILAAFSVS
jgi:hypothetical protein